MPSGELVGTTLKFTGREVTDGHSHFPTYRNYIVHDPVSGVIATAKKEELLVEIERQRELGDAGLLEEDKYLAEVNLEEMSTSSGERHHYWLLAIQTARNHYALRAQREPQQMAQSDTTGVEGR